MRESSYKLSDLAAVEGRKESRVCLHWIFDDGINTPDCASLLCDPKENVLVFFASEPLFIVSSSNTLILNIFRCSIKIGKQNNFLDTQLVPTGGDVT